MFQGAAILGALGLFLTACGGDGGESAGAESSGGAGRSPYSVAATIGMVADIVEQVAGDKATVKTIIGPGIDPHLYKPTRGDVATLQQADAVFYNGLLLEGKMIEALSAAARTGKPAVAVAESLDSSFLLQLQGPQVQPGSGHYDPHVWMDAQAWSQVVDVVAGALAEYDPPHADFYQANALSFREQLAALDDYVRGVIASIPEQQRALITAHDAFSYFGRAYGIEVMGIQGISTESEAGLQDINRLVDFIVGNNIQAVFVESSVSAKNVEALLEGARSRGQSVRIGGTLFSDAMGAAGTYEGTYIGMIDHNATLIARALGGQAPAGGMQGKLREAAHESANN